MKNFSVVTGDERILKSTRHLERQGSCTAWDYHGNGHQQQTATVLSNLTSSISAQSESRQTAHIFLCRWVCVLVSREREKCNQPRPHTSIHWDHGNGGGRENGVSFWLLSYIAPLVDLVCVTTSPPKSTLSPITNHRPKTVGRDWKINLLGFYCRRRVVFCVYYSNWVGHRWLLIICR